MPWTKVGNIRGPAGLGVPPGGTTGQHLRKKSNADNDTEWAAPDTGPAGPQGPAGPTGPTGAAGEVWFTGTGAPGTVSGAVVGDWYLDSATGNYYDLTALPSTWTLRGNLKGPAGATGAQGPTGATGSQGPAGVGVPAGGTAGQVLTKNTGTNYDTVWAPPAAGGAVKLDDLTDATIASPTDGQVLAYEAASSQWKNKPATGGVTAHSALTGLTTGDDHPQYVKDSGDTMTGRLTFNPGGGYVEGQADNLALKPPAGGWINMGGSVVGAVANPSNANDAVNKTYADQFVLPTEVVAGSGVTVSQPGDGTVVVGLSGGAPQQTMEVTFIADASANTTLTAMAAAEDYLATSVRHVTRLDLTGYTAVRMVVRRMATASAAGAVLNLKYSLTDPNNTFAAGAWSSIPLQVSINTTNATLDSGWVTIPAGMRVNNVYIAVTQAGGDGSAAPVIGSVRAFFRGPTGGAGATRLTDLLDTNIVTPADQQALIYVGADSAWENKPIPAVTVSPSAPSGGKSGDLWVQTTTAGWVAPASLPQGIVAFKRYTASVNVTSGAYVALMGLTNVALKAGRLYTFAFGLRALAAVAPNNGVVVHRITTVNQTAMPNSDLNLDVYSYDGPPGWYSGLAWRETFTVTVDGNYSPSIVGICIGSSPGIIFPTYIIIEDIGPIRGQQ